MIRAYTGLLGDGKTLSMVGEGVRLVGLDPVQIYTNMRSLKFPESVYLDAQEMSKKSQGKGGDSENPLSKVSTGIVLLDEGHLMFNSRFWQEVDRDVLASFAQLRKNGLDLFVTVQNKERMDKVLKELLNEEVVCRRIGGFVLQSTCLPGVLKPIKRRFIRLSPNLFPLYDTLEIIGKPIGKGFGWSSNLERLRGVRAERGRRRKRQVVTWHKPNVVSSDGQLTTLTREGYEAVSERGLVGREIPLSTLIEAAEALVRRRRWLRMFRIGPLELPFSCTFENPWLPGWGPVAFSGKRQDPEPSELLGETGADEVGAKPLPLGNGEKSRENKSPLFGKLRVTPVAVLRGWKCLMESPFQHSGGEA